MGVATAFIWSIALALGGLSLVACATDTSPEAPVDLEILPGYSWTWHQSQGSPIGLVDYTVEVRNIRADLAIIRPEMRCYGPNGNLVVTAAANPHVLVHSGGAYEFKRGERRKFKWGTGSVPTTPPEPLKTKPADCSVVFTGVTSRDRGSRDLQSEPLLHVRWPDLRVRYAK